MTSWWPQEYPYDAYTKAVINRAKLSVCKSSSFGGVKAYINKYVPTHVQTKSGFICIEALHKTNAQTFVNSLAVSIVGKSSS